MTIYQHEGVNHEAVAAAHAAGRRRPAAFPPPAQDLVKAQNHYLTSRGLDASLAWYNGWYPSRNAGDTADRIVIPASPYELRFWQARAIDPKEPKRYQSPHAARENAVIIVWSVYAMSRRLVVCEGPMDALAAASAGAFVGIGLMGNTPPAACFDYIAETWPEASALVVPDRDATAEGARWLTELTARDLKARLILLPTKDLAALAPEERAEALR